MGFQDLSARSQSVREILVEANGTPFAPCKKTRPVVTLLDGRRTNADLSPGDWIAALEETGGDVAIYFYLSGDHEWWLAYDADPEPGQYDDEHGLDGPYHTWTTYPSGPWEHSVQTREILTHHLEEIYMEGYPEESCSIYRSKVVPLREAREFVPEELRGGRHD